jgi:hypothetical protein
VVVPRIEIGASLSGTERFDTRSPRRDWTGPGLSLSAHGNLGRHLALAAEADTFFGSRRSLLAGLVRISGPS